MFALLVACCLLLLGRVIISFYEKSNSIFLHFSYWLCVNYQLWFFLKIFIIINFIAVKKKAAALHKIRVVLLHLIRF